MDLAPLFDERTILAVICSKNPYDLIDQQKFWLEISSSSTSEIHVVDIAGFNLDQAITATIEASLDFGTDIIAIESLSTICKTRHESAVFAKAIFDCGKRLFMHSYNEGLSRLAEIERTTVEKMNRLGEDEFMSIDLDDLPFLISYLSEEVTINTLVEYLENLSATVACLTDEEISAKLLAQDIRHAAILAYYLKRKE